jgi:hypothetical protein
MDQTRRRLLMELAAAGTLGALMAIQIYWQITRTRTMPLTESGAWWPAVLPITLLLHSGALLGTLIGYDVAGRMRLDAHSKDVLGCVVGMLGNAAVFALTWFMLRTGVANLKWRRIVAVAGWGLWIALGFSFVNLMASSRD